jgi:hypothetical protein
VDAAKIRAKKALSFWEFDLDIELDSTDIRDLMNDIRNFYADAEQYGIAIDYKYDKADHYKAIASEIVSAMKSLTTDYSSQPISDVLCVFSSNPIQVVDSFVDYLNQVELDINTVDSQMREEKEKQIKQGVWSDDVDPRFKAREENFNVLKGDVLS